MKKIKELFEIKNGIMVLAILLIVIMVAIGVGFLINEDDKETKELKEDKYIMYVKINPLIRVEFGEYYYICAQNKKEKVCSDKTNEVTDYVLVNDDAKELYGDIDLKGLSIIDALAKIHDTARDKEIKFDTIEIVANYEFDSENLKDEIAKESKYKVSFNVITTYNKDLKEEDVIDSVESNKYYTVSFNSNGGSKVESVEVKEGYGFTEPKIPTRSGYEFVEWQLDDKKYDFENKVTKDITLIAKWNKIKTTTTKEVNTTTTKVVENNNITTTKNTTTTEIVENNNTTTTTTTTTSCTPKKFNKKYSYFYTNKDECLSKGNSAFLEVSDNVNSKVFTYDCEQIVDDCGDTYYGVFFNVWNGEEVERFYY